MSQAEVLLCLGHTIYFHESFPRTLIIYGLAIVPLDLAGLGPTLWHGSVISTKVSVELAVGLLGYILVGLAANLIWDKIGRTAYHNFYGHGDSYWQSWTQTMTAVALAITVVTLVEVLLFRGILLHTSAVGFHLPESQKHPTITPLTLSSSPRPASSNSNTSHIDFIAWVTAAGTLLGGVGALLAGLGYRQKSKKLS
jgi:hypothetical protein